MHDLDAQHIVNGQDLTLELCRVSASPQNLAYPSNSTMVSLTKTKLIVVLSKTSLCWTSQLDSPSLRDHPGTTLELFWRRVGQHLKTQNINSSSIFRARTLSTASIPTRPQSMPQLLYTLFGKGNRSGSYSWFGSKLEYQTFDSKCKNEQGAIVCHCVQYRF